MKIQSTLILIFVFLGTFVVSLFLNLPDGPTELVIDILRLSPRENTLEIIRIVINAVISTLVSLTTFLTLHYRRESAKQSQKQTQIQQKKLKLEEEERKPDVKIEEWYPESNTVNINLTNLSDYRCKNLRLLFMIKPIFYDPGPFSMPHPEHITEDVVCEGARLRRSDNRVLKNPSNYLKAHESDIQFECKPMVQIVGSHDYINLDDGECVPFESALDKFIDNNVGSIQIQLMLLYERYDSEEEPPLRFFEFTPAISYPDHLQSPKNIGEYEYKPPLLVDFDNFEELFYARLRSYSVNLPEHVSPSTHAYLFSFDSDTLDEFREEG